MAVDLPNSDEIIQNRFHQTEEISKRILENVLNKRFRNLHTRDYLYIANNLGDFKSTYITITLV